MNKKAMGALPIIIIALVVVGFVVGGFYTVGQSQFGVGKVGDSAEGCDLAPTISLTVVDELNLGTTPSGSSGMSGLKNGKVAGAITSSTEFSKGDKVELLIGGSGYINETLPEITMGCGNNPVEGRILKLDGSPTVKVFNSAGDVVGDSATSTSGTNQSQSSDPITQEITFTVPSDEGVNGVVFVFEGINNTEIKEMTLSSSQATVEKYSKNKPDFHSQESSLTDSIFRSYRVSDIPDDGSKTTLNLLIEPESGETIGAGRPAAYNATAMYMTWYVENTFIDVDGKFKTDIENSDGTAMHISAASSDYDWSIA